MNSNNTKKKLNYRQFFINENHEEEKSENVSKKKKRLKYIFLFHTFIIYKVSEI